MFHQLCWSSPLDLSYSLNIKKSCLCACQNLYHTLLSWWSSWKIIPNNSYPRHDKGSKLDSKSVHAINQHPTKTPQISRVVPFSKYKNLQLNIMKKKVSLLFSLSWSGPATFTDKKGKQITRHSLLKIC